MLALLTVTFGKAMLDDDWCMPLINGLMDQFALTWGAFYFPSFGGAQWLCWWYAGPLICERCGVS